MAVLHVDEKQLNEYQPTKTDRLVMDYLEAETKDYYDEEIAQEPDFQVWYQLSSLRTGLFSWYPFKEDAQVLEIGAGFGGLTGLLCSRCAGVTATERSPYRASAIARRWQQEGNLEVYAGEWSEISFGKKFDYIILTGILERVCGGTSDRRAYSAYLKKVSGLLKEDGVVLLAVDNRLGLKYFCGAKESHGREAFEGIGHYPYGTRGYSFSREEIKDIVWQAGFERMEFYYPLPDYKLPQLIYSDHYLPEPNLRERLIPYYLNHNSLVAVEQDLYHDVVENGVFPFFANSFLVECGNVAEAEAIYAAVSTDRGRERGYATAIRKDGLVTKRPLYPEGVRNARLLYENIRDLKAQGIPVVEHVMRPDGSLELPYIPWLTLSNYIKVIIRTDLDKFLSLVDEIYENLGRGTGIKKSLYGADSLKLLL